MTAEPLPPPDGPPRPPPPSAPDAPNAIDNAAGETVCVVAPTGRDAALITHALTGAGVAAAALADVEGLCRRFEAGSAGAAVLAEEALCPASLARLEESLRRQPAWSDLPLVILTGGGKTTRYSARVVRGLEAKGNVTLLERPLRILTLVSAARAALRARRRQYEVRGLLEQSQRAVRQRDQFLAMLGHELRNPLAAIRTAIEVVNQAGAANPSGAADREVLAEQAQIITRQSTSVAHLVDDLLDVARVTSGKIVLDRRRVDLRDVAGRCVQSLRLAAGARRRHEVTFDAGPDPLPVDGDEVRLEQVVMNLLTNAVKFTPEGGRVQLSVDREGNEAVVRMRDTGVGIPADTLPHVFDLFVQAEQSLARSGGGLGIGLTIVRTLVQMHGGSIAAASDGPGRGSEFTVRLPLAAPAVPAPTAAPDDGVTCRPANGTARHVLLVEDNDDARVAMQRLLKLWGHSVAAAADGLAGVERAVADRPDVMLVDVGLPDIDGYEVARRVRAALGGGVCLIALTGYGQPDDRRRAEQAGFDRHLVKPVPPDQLRRILADLALRP